MSELNRDTIEAAVEVGTVSERTVFNKAHMSAIVDDVAKGAHVDRDDANPFAHFVSSRFGLGFGAGGASALDTYLERESAGVLAVRNQADDGYGDLLAKIGTFATSVVTPLSVAASGVIYKFGGNGSASWFVETSGDLHPSFDNGWDLGQAAARVRIGFFGTRVKIGANTSSTGALSLANTGGIFSRNAANSANVRIAVVNSSDEIVIGSTGHIVLLGQTAGDWTIIHGHETWRVDNTYDIGASGATRPRTIYAGTSVVALNVASPSGGLNVSGGSGSGIVFRSGTTNRLVMQADGVLYSAGSSNLGTSSIPWGTGYFGTALVVGTNPATAGAIRLPNTEYLYSRNAANSVNGILIGRSGGDVVIVGDSTASGLQLGASTLPLGSNALDLGASGTTWRTGYFGTSVISPAFRSTGSLMVVGTLDANALLLRTADTTRWQIGASGHLTAGADNTYDIGASGATRPRTGYFGTSVNVPVLENAAVMTIGTTAAQVLILKTNSTNRWVINSTGNFNAWADNTYDIGASETNRPRTGYFGTSVVTPLLIVSRNVVGPAIAVTNSSDDLVRLATTRDVTGVTFMNMHWNTTGTAGDNDVMVLRWFSDSDTTIDAIISDLQVVADDVTHATRSSSFVLKPMLNGSAIEMFRVGGSAIGFFGSGGIAQPTITGSRAGNAALADLLTNLAALGLIIDSTS